MEEELAKALRKADNQKQGMGQAPNPSASVPIQSKIWGSDAKRMSFDENMPYTPQYGASPLSSLLSGSPGSGIGGANEAGYNPGRRDSLKNMWHLSDFGTN